MLKLLFRRMMRLRARSSSYWILRNRGGYHCISRRFLLQAIGRTGLPVRKRYIYSNSIEVINTTWSLLMRMGVILYWWILV
ncbi:MAG: hypothetical protein RQ885_15645 [Desulfurococcales archaeon]|jgi:hypothetical protein|nr:hypothetical protein [Desulfurococcales archaeon]